ncbi:hypothetical protein bcgnr5411_40860 [Bacillus cereus]
MKNFDTGMILKELADASLQYSDNNAQNLILKQLGRPREFQNSMREIRDAVTNTERFKSELNVVHPGDAHDTSTPKALATSLQNFTIGDVLSTEKRDLLIDWMQRNTTGDNLIRAGVPGGWEVADKTDLESYGIRNDIEIIRSPNNFDTF